VEWKIIVLLFGDKNVEIKLGINILWNELNPK
jgi:hypothetical protein